MHDVDDITPISRPLQLDEEYIPVARFVAGRVKVTFDHTGNAEVQMRVPYSHKAALVPLTNYPGVEIMVQVLVPEGVLNVD